MTRTLLCVLLAGLVVVSDLAAQGGTITGKVLARERQNGEHSLLLEVESPNQVDRVELTLPQRYTFAPGFVPFGWKFSQDGRRVSLTGDRVFRLNVRLDAKPNENLVKNLPGRDVELQVGTPGTSGLTTLKTTVAVLPRVRFRDDWASLVSYVFPPEITPGAPLFGSPAPGYTDGVWIPGWQGVEDSLNRAEAAIKRAEALLNDRAKTAPPVRQRLFNWTKIMDEVADFRDVPSLNYYDQWLERVLEARPAVKQVPAATCTHGISGGTPMAFAGKDACMQGCFGDKLTDLEKAAAILLDGTLPVTPRAASPTTVVVGIPNEVTPGPHFLNWAGVPGQLSIRILQVQGSIDQNELWKGQSTRMRLQILGSDQAIPLKIVNRTPATIQVEGGDQQVISTSGGPVNVVARQVKGIMKGDFTIDYSVDQPPCGSR